MINKNDGWATKVAQQKLKQAQKEKPPKFYKELKNMYDKAVDGKVKILNARQIAERAINTKANSKNIDTWNKMNKILKKTKTIPFMYRTARAWNRPSLQEDSKSGIKENDHYYVSLARAGLFAKQYRQKCSKIHGNFREHPKYLQAIQHKFSNQLMGIDYEQSYRELKAWYYKVQKKINNKSTLKKLVSEKYQTRTPQKYINRDKQFIKSMDNYSKKFRFMTSVKSDSIAVGATNHNMTQNFHKTNFKKLSKHLKNTLVQNFKSTNYKKIGKNIKHGVKGLFNQFTGVAKKSGRIVADRLTKLGQRLNRNPRFNYASQYVTHLYDKSVHKTNKILEEINMPKVGSNAREPKHLKHHDYSKLAYTFSTHKHEIKHKLHINMHRTQHLDIGSSI